MEDSRRRALLVGIDVYQHHRRLTGCVNDVIALRELLATHYNSDPNFTCQNKGSSTDTVTRQTLLDELDILLAPGADIALLYFAGHGFRATSDVVLMTQEARSENDGVGLSSILGKVQESPVPEVIIILDCCFSGAAGRMPQLGSDVAVLRDGLALLTASRFDQTATETAEGRGLFSSLLCGALAGGAADVLGRVTLAGLYAYLAESIGSYGQQPTFKASLGTLHSLRDCSPALTRANLRDLVRLFDSSDVIYLLNKTYEPTEPSFIHAKGEILALLQRGRAARLVDPVAAEHLYYAAVNKKGCQLTPLGRHYWRRDSEHQL